MSSPSTSTPEPTMQQLRSSILTKTLHNFASSTSTFQLLKTISRSSPSSPAPPPKTLYILDSSFNPPTLAHLNLLTSALSSASSPPPNRILLLLSTQNADKAPKPASFEQRLIMMEIFARDLLSTLPSPSPTSSPSQSQPQSQSQEEQEIEIDLALTTLPYFHSKSLSISESHLYPPETTQIHLLGYDTLIRFLDTKYYPPSHSLSVLAPFLERHKLRVTYRVTGDGGYGKEREEQDAYLRELGEGKRESEGGKREWVSEGRIEMVEGRKEGEEVVSSTRVREAIRDGDKEVLGRLLSPGVREWVLSEGLYLNDE